MKKNRSFYVLILALLLFTVSACNFGFDSSRFYNQRRRSLHVVANNQNNTENNEANDEQSDNTGAAIDKLDTQSVQTLFDDAEAHKDDLFPVADLESKVFYMTSLAADTVAEYEFGNGAWQPAGTGEVYSNGQTLGSGIRSINSVKYYRYKSRKARWNNEFDPCSDDTEQVKKREERFLFFRFTASAAMNMQLDNSMLCVDTYTKFCWFYSEPGWFKSIAGNKVPKDWVDYENPNVSDNHTRAYGKFYYYDPIGYVEANGKVVLYEWIKNNLRNNNFKPRQNYLENAQRSPDSPGKSPYYLIGEGGSGSGGGAGGGSAVEQPPEIPVPYHEKGLLVQMDYIHNKDFYSIEQTNKKPQSYAWISAHMKTDIAGVSPKPEVKQDSTQINLDTFNKITGNNNFVLTPTQLKTARNFKIKTALSFANIQLWIGTKGADIQLVPENYGVLSFTFNPATPTEEASLTFNGIENPRFDNGYGGAVDITCAQLTAGQKIPLDEVLHLKISYIINGKFYGAAIFEERSVDNKTISIGYSLDFIAGEDSSVSIPTSVRVLEVRPKSIKNIDLDNYATDNGRQNSYTYFEADFQVNLDGGFRSVWKFRKEEGKIEKGHEKYNIGTISAKKSFTDAQTPNSFVLFTTLVKHDKDWRGKWKYMDIISDLAKDKIKFKYDNGSWKLDPAANSNLGKNNEKEKVTIKLPDGFELREGETKDFKILYVIDFSMNSNNTTKGSLEVTYSLSWKTEN